MSFEFSVDVMLAISSGSLSGINPLSHEWRKVPFFLLTIGTKVWASSLGQYRLMIHQWASLSTAAQDCFSLAHCKLIFFCVHVSAGFRFSFSFIALCFFSWELSWWTSFKSHANYRLVYIFRFLQVLFAMWFHNFLFHLLDVEKDKTCY